MNREIKFRGICKEEFHTHHEATEVGEFVYGYLVCPNKIRTAMSEEHGGIGPGIVHVDIEVDPETVGQFTGIKDIKGEDVYDGDIYKNLDNNLIGRFEIIGGVGGYHVNCTEWKDGEVYNNHAFARHDTTNINVIGNIYENEELLKQPA